MDGFSAANALGVKFLSKAPVDGHTYRPQSVAWRTPASGLPRALPSNSVRYHKYRSPDKASSTRASNAGTPTGTQTTRTSDTGKHPRGIGFEKWHERLGTWGSRIENLGTRKRVDAEEGAERRGVQGLVIGRGMARVSGRGIGDRKGIGGVGCRWQKKRCRWQQDRRRGRVCLRGGAQTAMCAILRCSRAYLRDTSIAT